MRLLLLLCCLSNTFAALTLTHVEGQLQVVPSQRGEKTFFHPNDTIESGQRLQTGATAIVHATLGAKHLILLPASEYRIYYTEELLQVTLSKGSLYIVDPSGGTTVNSGTVTTTVRGTTAIERKREQTTITAIKGGATVFEENQNYGELIRKGYTLTLRDTIRSRGFYKDGDILPLCEILPCKLKDALFCTRCPEYERHTPRVDSAAPLISGVLYLHPFTLEADNSFAIHAESFPKGIRQTELFNRIPHTYTGKKEYALYARRKKEGRIDYHILDGVITPDRNNPNRILCKLSLYSGEKDQTIMSKTVPLFILDDFSTGGKVIDPLFFEEAAKLIAKTLNGEN